MALSKPSSNVQTVTKNWKYILSIHGKLTLFCIPMLKSMDTRNYQRLPTDLLEESKAYWLLTLTTSHTYIHRNHDIKITHLRQFKQKIRSTLLLWHFIQLNHDAVTEINSLSFIHSLILQFAQVTKFLPFALLNIRRSSKTYDSMLTKD